jgi:hypothetical protein
VALLVGTRNKNVPTLSAGDISQHLLLVAGAKLKGDGMTMSIIAA